MFQHRDTLIRFPIRKWFIYSNWIFKRDNLPFVDEWINNENDCYLSLNPYVSMIRKTHHIMLFSISPSCLDIKYLSVKYFWTLLSKDKYHNTFDISNIYRLVRVKYYIIHNWFKMFHSLHEKHSSLSLNPCVSIIRKYVIIPKINIWLNEECYFLSFFSIFCDKYVYPCK